MGYIPNGFALCQTSPTPKIQSNLTLHQHNNVDRCFEHGFTSTMGVISLPCRLLAFDIIFYIMYTCIIMHNMIMRDKRGVVVKPCFEPPEESSIKEGASTSTGFGYAPRHGWIFLTFAVGNCTN